MCVSFFLLQHTLSTGEGEQWTLVELGVKERWETVHGRTHKHTLEQYNWNSETHKAQRFLETKCRWCWTIWSQMMWYWFEDTPGEAGNSPSVWPRMSVCTHVTSELTVRIPLTFSEHPLLKYSLTDWECLKSPFNYWAEQDHRVPPAHTSDAWYIKQVQGWTAKIKTFTKYKN